MAGVNKFLEFDSDKANIMTDADYASSTTRTGGLTTGIASALLHNKIFRQVTVMAAAIGKFIADAGGTADDSSVNSLTSAFSNSVVIPGASNASTQEVKTMLVGIDTRKVVFTSTSGVLTKVEFKDPTNSDAVVSTVNLNYTEGQLTSIQQVTGTRTVTSTLGYTSGELTQITKAVT